MKIIGVTGGTGSGKSTVSKILAENGAVVLDADKISKELQRKGTTTFKKIVEAFGESVVADDGELDRKALSEMIFRDEEKRLLINSIVHKEVARVFRERLKVLEEVDTKIAVLDVPIPTEEGFFELVNTVWAVVANDDLRIERIMERSGLTEAEAERRIASQFSNREYEELADVVIENERSYEELEKLVKYELERCL